MAKVLVVDDSSTIRRLIGRELKPGGYKILEAKDGAEALEMLRTVPEIRLITLDVEMPGMDGYQVCRQLKKDPETRLIPVVFLTGQESREARLAGLDAGATDFLNKPCELTELELRVRVYVGRAHTLGIRRATWSRSSTTRATIDAPASDGEIPAQFWTPVSRDEAFERRLLATVDHALQD